jgi:hypothetical protein
VPDVREPLRPADPLAEALFPVLVHRMNNATQLLSALSAAVAAGVDTRAKSGGESDLARASREVHELGWLLGVLASAEGADLLLERREAGGLSVLVRALGEALRRAGRELAAPPEVPRLAPRAADGWQVPWAIGSTLWCAAGALPRGSALRFGFARVGERWVLRCGGGGDCGAASLAQRLQRELAEAELVAGAGGLELALPGDWLIAGRSAPAATSASA